MLWDQEINLCWVKQLGFLREDFYSGGIAYKHFV